MSVDNTKQPAFGEEIEPELLVDVPPQPELGEAFRIVKGTDRARQKAPPGASLPNFDIYLKRGLLNGILEHIRTNRTIELTGIIGGHPFLDPYRSRPFIVGVRQIKFETPDQSRVYVHVDAGMLRDARLELQKEGLVPVLWYHSHPGHGIFLSSDDKQVTDYVWSASWHVAMVLSPEMTTEDAFGMYRGSEQEYIPFFYEIPSIPAEIEMAQLYNRALHKIKIDKYEDANSLFQQLNSEFQLKRIDLPYWQTKPSYRDVETHLRLLPLYEQAKLFIDNGDEEAALAKFQTLKQLDPAGYLDVNDQLRRLSIIGSPSNIDLPQQPSQQIETSSYLREYPDPTRKRHVPSKPGRPIPLRRPSKSSLLVILVIGGLSVLTIAGMLLLRPGNTEAPPVAAEMIVSTIGITIEANVTNVALDTQAVLPTNTLVLASPTPSSLLQPVAYSYSKLAEIQQPAQNPPYGTLVVRIVAQDQLPISGITVAVKSTNGAWFNLEKQSAAENMTNAQGEYIEDIWSSSSSQQAEVWLLGPYGNLSLVGDIVLVTITPQFATVITFQILPVLDPNSVLLLTPTPARFITPVVYATNTPDLVAPIPELTVELTPELTQEASTPVP